MDGFFNFSSEAEHVLSLFLFFGQIEPQRSYKVCSYKMKCYSDTYYYNLHIFVHVNFIRKVHISAINEGPTL